MDEPDEPTKEERRILLYLMAISLSYTVLVGGFLVFILILLNIDMQILGGFFSAYLTLALAMIMTFHHRLLKRFGLRKFFALAGVFFLIMSIVLLTRYFGIGVFPL
ncbi:hypothetical protein AKJ39_02095 [candidate division MSBL1 archaeon SCGC-AAA259J03]|uniref:Uncharacterized protein n=3 Tax=candidate division MSBL1 TaxID=215777 RepID=A0A656YX42_9EURY|nr:hypothetical protein AKJ61_00150 [candidate division MSBL1 archaeon SCGC-AAA259B11]KXA95532.1 hypothetical protein AKJ36_00365 [candidate division MSBL1 archaeon SCGC-AAA259I07]KXA98434.1 hypothetical protein AKJ39_02095 [candidate division MSBL1 archaeon SCGC-AAA259J03]